MGSDHLRFNFAEEMEVIRVLFDAGATVHVAREGCRRNLDNYIWDEMVYVEERLKF